MLHEVKHIFWVKEALEMGSLLSSSSCRTLLVRLKHTKRLRQRRIIVLPDWKRNNVKQTMTIREELIKLETSVKKDRKSEKSRRQKCYGDHLLL